jgi:cytochrome c oxidase assembly protein subunit 15
MLSMEEQDRTVAWWLLACCGLVFCMVVLGGFTRLTGSGLSMVDWRPLMGILPPLSDADWQRVYDMYRESPEYQMVNAGFGLEGFKSIFWLEYLHRLLGRIIGLVFFVPFVYFFFKGYVVRREWPKYLLMFALGGMQGLLGWYMVKSGLVDVPHVSQYRLTAHLVAAFAIYAYMFWVALSLLFPAQQDAPRHPWFGKTLALFIVLSVTIVSGGFVAGLKAGKIYNTFPMMGDYWIPPGLMALEPSWREPICILVIWQVPANWQTRSLKVMIIHWTLVMRISSIKHLLRMSVSSNCLQVSRIRITLAFLHSLQTLVVDRTMHRALHCLQVWKIQISAKH